MVRVHPDGRVYINGFDASIAEVRRLIPGFQPVPDGSHEYTGSMHIIRVGGRQNAGPVPWQPAQLIVDNPDAIIADIVADREARAATAIEEARQAEIERRAALPLEERIEEDLAAIGKSQSLACALAIRFSGSWARQDPRMQAVVTGIIDEALAVASTIELD